MRWPIGLIAAIVGLLSVNGELALSQTPPPAGISPISWQLRDLRTRTGKQNVELRARIPEGWYLYSLTQPAGGPERTRIDVLAPWFAAAAAVAPEPQSYPDRNFDIMSEVYTDSVRFILPLSPSAMAAPPPSVSVAVRYQTCTARFCLPARTDTITLALRAAPLVTKAESSVGASNGTSAPTSETKVEIAVTRVEPRVETADRQPNVVVTATDRQRLLITAVMTALLALVTPCVFPMIPITVGFFSGRAGQSHTRSLRDIATFAIGIIAAFVVLGVGTTLVVGATGAFTLAANPWVNLGIALIFTIFALQLSGLVTLAAPHSIVTRLTVKSQSGQGIPTLLLMGVTFALTSFTCTAPFIGSLLVTAATGGVWEPLVGTVTFAAVFTLPFLALAAAPSFVHRLPQSGEWLATTKRIAAFAELAVAVKYVSNSAMVWEWSWMRREVVIGAWIIIAAMLLWTLIRPAVGPTSPRASGALRYVVGVPAVVALMVWLVLGASGRTLGELEAYLPPRDQPRAGADELHWTLNDWSGTLRRAAQSDRPIIVDFTGYTCTNCRWMEANMFPRTNVRRMLTGFERVRLFTDGIGEPYRSQQRLQAERFGSVALPLYAVLDGEGRTISTFVGMTRNENEFLAFLAKGVAARVE